ncbi:MAG TPA: PEP-CTERM sorting domain-containing protein [Fimbriiglobus sp.]|nr:PEP-CTERM sorting domain-containing protein [Fimbriiglobus sp.]
MPRQVLTRLFSVRLVCSIVVVTATCWTASGQQQGSGSVSLTSFTAQYAQDFNGLVSTSGISNGTAATLPTGWYFVETGSSANAFYSTSSGGASAGDTYSYGPSGNTDRAFGTLLGSNLTPTIGASFTNNTGTAVTGLQIAYFGEQWRHGQADANIDRLDFQYSTDATSLTTGTWTNFDGLDFTTPNIIDSSGALNGNASQNRTALTGTITGLNMSDGATFWIRWSDLNVGGLDDGLAVDDFNITPTPVPEPATVLAVAAAGLGLAGLVRRLRRNRPTDTAGRAVEGVTG